MRFFSKIFKNKQVVTIAALILCFVILIVAYKYRVDKAINAVSVPIATRTLEAREKIDEDCFETRKVAQSMLSSNVITNKNELLGDGDSVPAKYVNYNTFIPEGSLFYRSAVTTWDKMPDSVWADLPDGKTMYSLKVDDESTYGNSIYPGDKIDLFYRGNANGKDFFGPLIKGITVLAVKDGNGNHIFKKSANQERAVALIFAVNNEEFLFLHRAEGVGGTLVPVLRNTDYNPEAMTIESEFIKNFIEVNSYKSVDDDEINNNKVDNVKDNSNNVNKIKE